MHDDQIFAIERPHPHLAYLYLLRSLFTGPGIFVAFPLLLVRYLTLRYTFDDQGISMRWGVLFRREVNVTYARIQDIHLTSGVLQRWLGLADVQVQTASGSATAEVTIEGLKEFEAVRNFLYGRMRGVAAPKASAGVASADADAVELLRRIASDIRAVRERIEARDV